MRPALGRFRAGVQEGPCHQGRPPSLRDRAPVVGASLESSTTLLPHGRRERPAVPAGQHLPATWPTTVAFGAAEHGGIVTGWSLCPRIRVGRILRTRAGAATEVFKLRVRCVCACVRACRDEHGLSGFGVCLGDGHVARGGPVSEPRALAHPDAGPLGREAGAQVGLCADRDLGTHAVGLAAHLLFKSRTKKGKWTLEQRDQEIPSV